MKWPKAIQDLATTDTHTLASVLSLPPDTSCLDSRWLQEQAQLISNLPFTLKNHPSFLSRLSKSITAPRKAGHPCLPHRLLNRYIIHQAFLLLQAECSSCLMRLVEKKPFLPSRILDFVNRLHGLHALWMARDLFHLRFGEVPPDQSSRECIASGCEACIMAAIGADDMVLSDLRAALIGRKKKNRPDAELLPLVEAWINLDPRSEVIFLQSDRLGAEILRCRREMQRARRREKMGSVGGAIDWESLPGAATLVHESSRNEVRERHHLERSIINCYMNRLSSSGSTPGNMHPSLERPLSSATVTEPAHRTSIVPRRSSWNSAYSESIYSNPSGTMNPSSPQSSWLLNAEERPEEYAEQYRSLVVVVEEDKESIDKVQHDSGVGRGKRDGQ